jgi:Flp pilus assembly protein TadG
MIRLLIKCWRDISGAVAALYAIALFGLVAIAGVGWDYGRMMAMDSELQNAADQAALAAATQLNGRAGAITRAEAAARNYLASSSSQFVNVTRMANDGAGRAITNLSFTFYESYDSAADTFGTATTVDASARVVRVVVNGREAFFALTPIVGLISSGQIAADAVAGTQSSACNVPPLMFCAPAGNPNFPGPGDIGKALDLREKPQGSETWTPGNFDLLQIAYDNIANSDQNRTLGLNSDLLGCTGAAILTRPGERDTENRAVNTRFDIYPNGNNMTCQGNGNFCPAQVVRNTTQVRRIQSQGSNPPALCNAATAADYTVVDASTMPTGHSAASQGFPLDTCQLNGLAGCLSFGDGVWDFNQYMASVHPGASTNGIDVNNDGRITRHEVYNWERADASRTVSTQIGDLVPGNGNQTIRYCTHPTPQQTAVVPSATQKDRRVVTVASVDCTGQSGRFPITTIRWVDLFLLGPVTGSAGSGELRAEVIGPARRADGGTGFQTFGRNKPVLLR